MRGRSILLAGLAAVSAFGVVGCKEEPPPPPPPPPPPAPPPPAPEPIDIQGLLAEMDADARITFPQSVAPVDADLGRAVVSFAEAFLEGDDEALRSMLDLTGQAVLDRLLVTGGWYDATDELEAMLVTELREFGGGQGGSVTYAIQTPGSAYTLAWNVEPGPGGALAFSGEFTNAEERPRASDFSGGEFIEPEIEEPEETDSTANAPAETGNIEELSSGLLTLAEGAPPIMTYMVIETTAHLVSAAVDQPLTGAQLVEYTKYSADRNEGRKIRRNYKEGLELYDDGGSVTEAQLKELVEIAMSQAEMFRVSTDGQIDISDDDVYAAVSKTVGINPTSIKSRTGGG